MVPPELVLGACQIWIALRDSFQKNIFPKYSNMNYRQEDAYI